MGFFSFFFYLFIYFFFLGGGGGHIGLKGLKRRHFRPYHDRGELKGEVVWEKGEKNDPPLRDYHFGVLLFVVVVLLFYVHGKHLRSCRDGQLT